MGWTKSKPTMNGNYWLRFVTDDGTRSHYTIVDGALQLVHDAPKEGVAMRWSDPIIVEVIDGFVYYGTDASDEMGSPKLKDVLWWPEPVVPPPID